MSDVFPKGKKGKLPAGMNYYFKLQMFVKDCTAPEDKSLYMVFLCTLEGKGKEFIDLDLGREQPTEEHYKKLKQIHKLLTRSWVEVDMMVESIQVAGAQPVFFLVDTELKA